MNHLNEDLQALYAKAGRGPRVDEVNGLNAHYVAWDFVSLLLYERAREQEAWSKGGRVEFDTLSPSLAGLAVDVADAALAISDVLNQPGAYRKPLGTIDAPYQLSRIVGEMLYFHLTSQAHLLEGEWTQEAAAALRECAGSVNDGRKLSVYRNDDGLLYTAGKA